MKRTGKRNNNNNIQYIVILLLLMVVFLTVGYSAFSDNLEITNSVAYVRAHKVVRINGVVSDSATDMSYTQSGVYSNVTIPAGGTANYTVTVTNLGNVPVAVSNVTIKSGGQVVSGLSSNITENNYVKICENNICTGPISKEVNITITNNNTSTINTNLEIFLTFTEVYEITYKNNKIGETLAGHNFTHTFNSNPPSHVLLEGTRSGESYSNNTISIQNVNSNISINDAYTITYNDSVLDTVLANSNYSHTFTTEIPKTMAVTGTYTSSSYENYTISITNVGSDLVLVPTYGKIEITNISLVSNKNATNLDGPTFNGMSATFNIKFKKEEGSTDEGFEIVYSVDLTNDYVKDYTFRGFDFDPTINSAASSDTAILHLEPIGVTNGEIIHPGQTKTFQIKLWLEASNPNGSYTYEGDSGVDTTETGQTEEGSIEATITPLTGNLQSPNERAQFTVTVTNNYESEKTFNLLSSNSNLQLVDANNNSLELFTISGESTVNYTVYIKKHPNAAFLNETATTDILLSPTGLANTNIDTLTLNVDKFAGVDNDKVIVKNAAISMHYESSTVGYTTGRIDATWERHDEGGTAVKDYGVLLYDSSDTFITEAHTNSSLTSVSFTGVNPGTYYIKVYGVDDNTSGLEDIGNADTTPGYATKSSSVAFKWTYTVNTSGLNNLTSSASTSVNIGSTYTTTIRAGSWPNNEVPDNLTVTMEGTDSLSNGNGYDYTKTSTSQATLKIYNVTGNIRISGSASCLVEGTKILLANGEYKSIENIDYDDLLMVHNYETGKLTYEYPIWIEKEKKTKTYQENTFSDGTILKTVGWHGVFSPELNRFVSVDNPQEFHIGSRIAKLNKDRTGYDIVTVTNIKKKTEPVNYYHIVSTRYYNVIANDILTTDGTTILSNLYGFSDNITWNNDIRKISMNDVYSYDDLKDAVPYYMFKGMRAEEGKTLINYGLDLNTFKGYLIENQNNPNLLRPPLKKDNQNMWMVTTSIDNVTSSSKAKFLKPENSIYTLPKIDNNNFVGWLNTSDNKMYLPNDKITVYHGMHFEAIYK